MSADELAAALDTALSAERLEASRRIHEARAARHDLELAFHEGYLLAVNFASDALARAREEETRFDER